MINIEQIKASRALLNWKQNELAEKAGISTGTLNNIERGFQTDPKLSTLKAIELALKNEGVDFSEDIDGTINIRYRPRSKNKIARVLIIDDNNSDRTLYKTWLGKHPHISCKIYEAADARSGYESFIEHAPQCIILDFMMYGKNGFQLLVQMKENDVRIPPIIFVTSAHTDLLKKEAIELGVQVSLDKKQLTCDRLYEEVQKAIR